MNRLLIVTFLIALTNVYTAESGPNAGASVYFDFDPATVAVDSQANIGGRSELWVAVVARDVANLDVYGFEVLIDTSVLTYLNKAEDNAMAGLDNVLKRYGGQTTGLIGGKKRSVVEDTISIGNTLVGSDTALAPQGSGLLALLKFGVKRQAATVLRFGSVQFVDSYGTLDNVTTTGSGRLDIALGVARFHGKPAVQANPFVPATVDLRGRTVVRRMHGAGLQALAGATSVHHSW